MKNERRNLKEDPRTKMEEQSKKLRGYRILRMTLSKTTRRKKGREDWKGSRSKTTRWGGSKGYS